MLHKIKHYKLLKQLKGLLRVKRVSVKTMSVWRREYLKRTNLPNEPDIASKPPA